MHKVTLEINNSIYEHIMFFLRNLPKNLVHIQQDTHNDDQIDTNYPQSSISKIRNLQGVGKELYQGIDSNQYIKELRDEW